MVHTTVLAVLRDGRAAMGSDGQVTVGQTVLKHGASKVRRIGDGILAGFAGSAADGLTLFERFEAKLGECRGNLPRAAVALAKDWRTDRSLRRLEAVLLVCDREHLLLVSGSGDVVEPDDGVVGAGSGGPYAVAAARALLRHTELPVDAVVREALRIAAEICIFTNDRIVVETL
ncbi:MAG: HslU--HslV peptidase proteolytic subunit [candidate division GAL15 bacterium]